MSTKRDKWFTEFLTVLLKDTHAEKITVGIIDASVIGTFDMGKEVEPNEPNKGTD